MSRLLRGRSLQRAELDPDEARARDAEDAALKAKAERALKDNKPQFAVHEILWRLVKNHRLNENFNLSGSQYKKDAKGVTIELSGKGARTQGTIVGGDELLKRLAAGKIAEVVKEVTGQMGLLVAARGTVDFVFLMGADRPKSGNPFYREAKRFFETEYPKAIMVEDVRDLSGINKTINAEGKPVGNLYVVSHAHEDGTVQFSLDPNDKTPRQIDFAELKEANAQGSVTAPDPGLVGFWTHVQIRGCNLGRSQDFLEEMQTAFGGDARLTAPTHGQVYGGGEESLAGPYYTEAGKSKLTDEEAFAKIKAKPEYAFITDWAQMRKSLRRFDSSTPYKAYEGVFPAPGQELALLRRQVAGTAGKPWSFVRKQASGTTTTFTYQLSDGKTTTTQDVDVETPPTDAEAIAQAKALTPNPETYTFGVRVLQRGLDRTIIVDVQRTSWELYHSNIRKGGKKFDPSTGTKPWYGEVD